MLSSAFVDNITRKTNKFFEISEYFLEDCLNNSYIRYGNPYIAFAGFLSEKSLDLLAL